MSISDVSKVSVKQRKLNESLTTTFLGLAIMTAVVFVGLHAVYQDFGVASAGAVSFFFFMVGGVVAGLGVASYYEKD